MLVYALACLTAIACRGTVAAKAGAGAGTGGHAYDLAHSHLVAVDSDPSHLMKRQYPTSNITYMLSQNVTAACAYLTTRLPVTTNGYCTTYNSCNTIRCSFRASSSSSILNMDITRPSCMSTSVSVTYSSTTKNFVSGNAEGVTAWSVSSRRVTIGDTAPSLNANYTAGFAVYTLGLTVNIKTTVLPITTTTYQWSVASLVQSGCTDDPNKPPATTTSNSQNLIGFIIASCVGSIAFLIVLVKRGVFRCGTRPSPATVSPQPGGEQPVTVSVGGVAVHTFKPDGPPANPSPTGPSPYNASPPQPYQNYAPQQQQQQPYMQQQQYMQQQPPMYAYTPTQPSPMYTPYPYQPSPTIYAPQSPGLPAYNTTYTVYTQPSAPPMHQGYGMPNVPDHPSSYMDDHATMLPPPIGPLAHETPIGAPDAHMLTPMYNTPVTYIYLPPPPPPPP